MFSCLYNKVIVITDDTGRVYTNVVMS